MSLLLCSRVMIRVTVCGRGPVGRMLKQWVTVVSSGCCFG